MLIYAIVTVVCLVLDLIAFFIGVSYFSNDMSEYSYAGVSSVFLAAIFITLDLYYIIWVAS